MQLEINSGLKEASQCGAGLDCGSTDFVDFLVRTSRIDSIGAARIRSATETGDLAPDHVLLELGLLPEKQLALAQAEYLNVPLVEAHEFPEEAVGRELIPEIFLRAGCLLPLSLDEEAVTAATARPFDQQAIEALAYYLDRKVNIRVAPRGEWERAFARLYATAPNAEAPVMLDQATLHEGDVERLKDSAREAPVVRFVTNLISEAVRLRASDIHIEPHADQLQIRLRIDGVLFQSQTLPKPMSAGVISRIKILARLNIAERRLPQDGRIALPVEGRMVDFRVSTVPTLYGESVVLRVLDRQDLRLEFPLLGFSAEAASFLCELVKCPNGIVLVSGPTGSGKTTTLYAALCEVRRQHRKILTIEDPVEYCLDQVIQTQIKPEIGLDFATGLRAFLRHDPDVIMVGEIRDGETARTAVQASLTGHLVLSTVHTNNAAASLSRLLDMGVESYLLVSTLRAVVAQRLVRKLCIHCRKAKQNSAALLEHLRIVDKKTAVLHEPVGCDACGGSGYRGRTTIYEILQFTPGLQHLVLEGATDSRIEQAARNAGMKTLFEEGLSKALAGETSLEEVLRVTSAPS
jgi:general secretion pathway protein E